jgi:hypothetical protein
VVKSCSTLIAIQYAVLCDNLEVHFLTIVQATDFESFIGHTNEFNFSVRAFHHAHQAYLVPEVLKRAYGGRTPAVALFAENMNYKVIKLLAEYSMVS